MQGQVTQHPPVSTIVVQGVTPVGRMTRMRLPSDPSTKIGDRPDPCPKCSGMNVRHLVIGLPALDEEYALVPPWEVNVGCVHPGYTRECLSCGNRWELPPRGRKTPTAHLRKGPRDGRHVGEVAPRRRQKEEDG